MWRLGESLLEASEAARWRCTAASNGAGGKKQSVGLLCLLSGVMPAAPTAESPLPAGSDGSGRRRWGLWITAGIGGTLVALYAVVTPFVAPALRRVCLPFVPATSAQIENVLKMLRGRRGSVVDIGSGDGRIVIAAAKRGFEAVGYELNPWLVWYSRYRAWRDGVHHNAKFYISDLWKVSFSRYTNVVVFGVPQMMPELEKKLKEELECNARIIACRFPFPCWIPDHTTGEGVDTVWAYDLKHSGGFEARNLKITPERES